MVLTPDGVQPRFAWCEASVYRTTAAKVISRAHSLGCEWRFAASTVGATFWHEHHHLDILAQAHRKAFKTKTGLAAQLKPSLQLVLWATTKLSSFASELFITDLKTGELPFSRVIVGITLVFVRFFDTAQYKKPAVRKLNQLPLLSTLKYTYNATRIGADDRRSIQL
ncbi:hypothetical protein BaRGS_00024474 [Batillaria attramentaria]|uniref:Uncharacterized protein n=1 Tax=Batillaria attramentaria TaxID=370345 RepID=A0ABD0KAS3_9CAEN